MTIRKDHLALLWELRKLSIDNIVERVILQKTVYLLAKFGYKGFRTYKNTYSMYIYGPYSPEVAKDAYSLDRGGRDGASNISNSEKAELKEKMDKLDAIINAIPYEDGEPSEIVYELVADILYFHDEDSSILDDKLFEKLVKKHDYFNDRSKFSAAMGILRAHRLIG